MGKRYAIEQRIRFIDFLLSHYGYFNRSALETYYGISKPQASADISDYLEINPNGCVYNNRNCRYERSDSFNPAFGE